MHQVMVRSIAERERRTRVAWERFVAGDDDVQGVPVMILLSWHRSRDLYGVDPLSAGPSRASGAGATSLLQNSVVTRLGGIAAMLAAGAGGSVTTVTDGSGRILGSWGEPALRRKAAGINLAPMYAWSESSTGTNGMGTALGRTCPVTVRGCEHWCACLHEWTSNGVSVSDVVTGQPVAALTVSTWRQEPSPGLAGGLQREVAPIRNLLREQAARDGAELVRAFVDAGRKAAPGEAIVAADSAGNVVAANQQAHAVGGRLPPAPTTAPDERRNYTSIQLRRVAAESRIRSLEDPQWSGTFRLDVLHEELAFEVRPVHAQGTFVGILLVGSERSCGELPADPAVGPGGRHDRPVRIAGVCDDRMILLSPGEIRYAEADRHTVWLVTDRGRVRALERGLDNVEHRLGAFGFLRVHRGYLVNVHRVREVEQGMCRGTLTVSTQHHGRESIPVARRQVPALRTALGI